MTEVKVGEADRGRLIQVIQGSHVLLHLPENPSTGYSWELEPLQGDTLMLQADTYLPPTSLIPGAGGIRLFEFLARSPGLVLLQLDLRQPWKPKDRAETFEVTIRVVSNS